MTDASVSELKAAFWIDGNAENAGKLASVKGQLEAVQDAMKVNKCID